jgi:hypothetical protein
LRGVDPIADFVALGGLDEIKSTLARLLDVLQRQSFTVLMTPLKWGASRSERDPLHVSSRVDTWIALDLESMFPCCRRIACIVKSRGTQHSHLSVATLALESGS